eukprot:COSAG06_NODE_3646_length_5077_cov_8.985536_3_plen_108_part_00
MIRIQCLATYLEYPLPRECCFAKECCLAAMLRRVVLLHAPGCSGLLRSARAPVRAAPRAIQQGNGRPRPAVGSRASATDELHDELLARYEKDVPVRWRNYLPRNLPS